MTVKLSLASGQIIEFSELKLYDSNSVKQLSDLYSSIDKNFRGFSTGIGFIGDAEHVVAGSLVKGVIEGAVSGSMATTAAKQVAEASELYRRIRSNGIVVSVANIENIDLPQPELWKVPHFKSNAKVELTQIPSKYIIVRKDGRDFAVFWDKVESYCVTHQ